MNDALKIKQTKPRKQKPYPAPGFRVPPAEYLRDIEGVSAVQVGLYHELLLAYWDGMCSLPEDEAEVTRLITVKGWTPDDLKAVLARYFPGGKHIWLTPKLGVWK